MFILIYMISFIFSYSAMNDKQKAAAVKTWSLKWDKFIAVVKY